MYKAMSRSIRLPALAGALVLSFISGATAQSWTTCADAPGYHGLPTGLFLVQTMGVPSDEEETSGLYMVAFLSGNFCLLKEHLGVHLSCITWNPNYTFVYATKPRHEAIGAKAVSSSDPFNDLGVKLLVSELMFQRAVFPLHCVRDRHLDIRR